MMTAPTSKKWRGRRVFGLAAVALLLAGCTSTAQRAGDDPADGPIIVDDACPFECCVYGTWVAIDSLSLRAEPAARADVVAVIPPATRFSAKRGHVRVDTPGRAHIEQPLQLFRIDGSEGPLVPAAETVALLHPLGEGFLNVQYGDSMWSADFGGGDRGVTIEQDPEWSWWAEVDLDGDRLGWLDVRSARIYGNDRCGPPMTWRDEWLEQALAGFAERAGAGVPVRSERQEASVDLNGDLYDDALVLLNGPMWCGSGGCTMVILQGSNQGLEVVSEMTLIRGPIVVSRETHNGWRDIVVGVRGGGAEPMRVALRHDGRRYPRNPSVQTPLADASIVEGVELFGP